MKFVGFTYEQLLYARDHCGVQGLYFISGSWSSNAADKEGVSTYRKDDGTVRHFCLCLRVPRIEAQGPRGGRLFTPHPYCRTTGRLTADGRPRYTTGAVNWEGHYAFLAALFAQQPDGKVSTKLQSYDNEADFLFRCNASAKAPHGAPELIFSGGHIVSNTRPCFGDL